MKTALIIPGIGQDARVTTPVLNTLVAFLGHAVELHVFPLRYPAGGVPFRIDAAVVHPVDDGHTRLRRLVPDLMAKIRAEHRRGSFDLIHGVWLFEPGAIAVAAARLLGTPSVVSIGGAEVVHLPDIAYGGMQTVRGRVIQRQILERATVVTGGSRYILDRARDVAPRRDSFELSPLPVDTDAFTPGDRRLLNDPSAPRILHAASLIPVKDQTTLIEAFALLKQWFPGASLTIAGEDPFGHRAGLESLVSNLGLSGAVLFAGAIPHSDMPATYREADLFMLSSRHESQGMVVLESAACGVPTVGSAVGVVADLAPEATYPVPPRSPDALAEAARQLLSSPERLRRMGANARERVVSGYRSEVAVRRFLEIYGRAMGWRAV